jgi:trehalose 6-phosphate phosphatase
VPFDRRNLDRMAILLDVDGTLLEIAPTPRAVAVPRSLPRTLADVSDRVGGALALVSGRPISELDIFFAPLRLPAVGVHGAEMRAVAGGPILNGRVAQLDPVFKQRLMEIAAAYADVLIEDKGYSLALHFRKTPEQGAGLMHDVTRAVDASADASLEILAGKSVIEIKPAGFNKGTAVRDLMTYPPFAGRVPVFVGDDKTDEDAFAVLPEFNGYAMSVGRKILGVDDRFQSPADVRRWLEHLSGGAAVSS